MKTYLDNPMQGMPQMKSMQGMYPMIGGMGMPQMMYMQSMYHLMSMQNMYLMMSMHAMYQMMNMQGMPPMMDTNEISQMKSMSMRMPMPMQDYMRQFPIPMLVSLEQLWIGYNKLYTKHSVMI